MAREPGLKIGLVAGEPSGDLLGAGLMSALKALRGDVQFTGVGGPRMIAEGLDSRLDMTRFSINGFVEPLRRLPELVGILRQLREGFLADELDVFVGVDFNVFNLLLEGQLKRRGMATAHYVSPSVYAWRRGRVRRIGRSTDLVMALFPFEPAFYTEWGVRAEFVGHPLADEIPLELDVAAVREELGIAEQRLVIALLPGSRGSEVRLLGPVVVEAAHLLVGDLPDPVFLVPCLSPAIREAMTALVAQSGGKADFRLVDGDARLPLAACDAAIVKSGTATLEAMLLRKPMVVAYRMGALSYRIVKALMHSPYIALPNILTGRELVPEFFEHPATPEALAQALKEQLERARTDPSLFAEFDRQHRILRRDASGSAARAVLSLVDRASDYEDRL